ncbi:MAG: MBL fold metallo-hydrolase [Candidatus Taylorbacteria bacterium]|nr:MBL fold metallo-hydrolase [Candidatus Taylorbacteria bacterium]
MQNIYLTCWGGVGIVTGANFLLEHADKKILIDCGLIQGEKFATDDNRKPFPYNPSEIDYLFVTHAHLDHVGRIPKLVKDGFKGVIYSTPETKSLGVLILEDACRILEKDATHDGVLPMYEMNDVNKAISLWKEIPYHQEFTVYEGLSVYLRDAGHVLGSSMFEFHIGGKKIMFTGDLGNSPTLLLKDTEEIKGIDYLVMESVYGDRNHEPKDERRKKLMDVINETAKRGGAVVIPAFSLERTQIILYELNHLVENKLIQSVPIFIDSPLAIKVTAIYKQSKNYFNDKVQEEIRGGDDIFNFPRLKYSMSGQDSMAIRNTPNPKIIIAGSGMSAGGRVTHHEINYLPDARSTILLVGYQTLGTLGRRLQDGEKKVLINGQEVEVKAHIETINGYSSHKDSDHLVEFVDSTRDAVKEIFVVMGEPKASLFLVQKLRDNLGVNAIYPERGKKYELG